MSENSERNSPDQNFFVFKLQQMTTLFIPLSDPGVKVFMILNISLKSKINISLCSYLFFIDHSFTCWVNYSSIHCL